MGTLGAVRAAQVTTNGCIHVAGARRGRDARRHVAPEDWADPPAFYTALERIGTPRAEIVEPVTPQANAGLVHGDLGAPVPTGTRGG